MSFVKTAAHFQAASSRTYDFFDAEMVTAYWLTRPEIVERLLPPPLAAADDPLVYAFVANYPHTNFGPPYREGALFLKAQFDGQVGGYCLAMPVTGDMAMAGGREIFGFPKKMADVTFVKEEDMLKGSLKRHGQRFFEVEADLTVPPNDADFLAFFGAANTVEEDGAIGAISYNFKNFQAPEGGAFDYPPRLVRQKTLLRPQTTLFGRAQVSLPPSDCDPWHEVEIVKMLGAIYIMGNNQMLPGEVVAEVDDATFAPYAFLKWDD
jgi:acetoacetate decarboxylase